MDRGRTATLLQLKMRSLGLPSIHVSSDEPGGWPGPDTPARGSHGAGGRHREPFRSPAGPTGDPSANPSSWAEGGDQGTERPATLGDGGGGTSVPLGRTQRHQPHGSGGQFRPLQRPELAAGGSACRRIPNPAPGSPAGDRLRTHLGADPAWGGDYSTNYRRCPGGSQTGRIRGRRSSKHERNFTHFTYIRDRHWSQELLTRRNLASAPGNITYCTNR